jgi:chromate transporter
MVNTSPNKANRLKELAGIFLKLGLISFGGQVAHNAMMEEEIVHRRNWITRVFPGPCWSQSY